MLSFKNNNLKSINVISGDAAKLAGLAADGGII